MPAAVARHRAFLLLGSAVLYPAIFVAFLAVERPGIGIAHLFYFPVAMIALAAGPYWGAAAGVGATSLYALGIVVNPRFPLTELFTTSTPIRLVTYTSMGALVGWFAHSNRDLVEQLQSAEEHDFLTGLLNTRAFDVLVSAKCELSRPFGLILGDVDNLREINDHEGHAVGNDLLRRVGDILARNIPSQDSVARIGGDEFAVITSAPGTEAVRAVCSRLTAALADEGLSMSFGWAVCPRDGNSPLLLFRAADERLYAQKLIRSRLSAAEVVALPSRAERLRLRTQSG
jgi:diguanylate cyclase (GGDEF)-like protein